MTSATEHTAIIQSLYRALTDKKGFEPFLSLLCQHIGACSGQLVTLNKAPMRIEHLWHAGLSIEFVDWYLENDMISHDVVSNYAVTQKPGLFHNALPLLPQLQQGKDYQRWQSDQDMLDSAWLLVHSSEHQSIVLALQRTVAQGPYQKHELAELNTFVPYIRQAVHLSLQIGQSQQFIQSFSSVIDALPQAAIILNKEASVVYANQKAQHLLKACPLLSITQKRLVFHTDTLQKQYLQSALRVIAASLGEQDYFDDTSVVAREHQTPLLLLMRPILDEGLLAGGVLLSVIDAQTRQLPSQQSIAAYFDLTVAEAAVCHALLSGDNIKTLAKNLHKSEATLRAHLKSIFLKTGCHRQGELISRVLSALMV